MKWEINGLIMGLKQSSLSIVALGFNGMNGRFMAFLGDFMGIESGSMVLHLGLSPWLRMSPIHWRNWICHITVLGGFGITIFGWFHQLMGNCNQWNWIKQITIPFGVISYLARWEIASQPGKRWENHQTQCLVGGWPTPLKNMTSSVGMIIPLWLHGFDMGT